MNGEWKLWLGEKGLRVGDSQCDGTEGISVERTCLCNSSVDSRDRDRSWIHSLRLNVEDSWMKIDEFLRREEARGWLGVGSFFVWTFRITLSRFLLDACNHCSISSIVSLYRNVESHFFFFFFLRHLDYKAQVKIRTSVAAKNSISTVLLICKPSYTRLEIKSIK